MQPVMEDYCEFPKCGTDHRSHFQLPIVRSDIWETQMQNIQRQFYLTASEREKIFSANKWSKAHKLIHAVSFGSTASHTFHTLLMSYTKHNLPIWWPVYCKLQHFSLLMRQRCCCCCPVSLSAASTPPSHRESTS